MKFILPFISAIIIIVVLAEFVLLKIDNDQPLCFVNPKDLEDKTRSQTSHSAVVDISSECMGMTREKLQRCKIPNILHSVVIGGSFKFHHYLSLKSIHDRIRPDKIFLHGYDFPYESEYFNQSIEEFKIELVHSRKVDQVYNRSVDHVEHKSDVIRLESLIRFGGMYFDLDVYAFKDIDPLLKSDHDFIIAAENGYGLNNGVMMSKRCSTFPLLWYDEYRFFNSNAWSQLSIEKPKAMYDKLGGESNLIGLHVDKSLSSDWGSGILFRNYNETSSSFWNDTRLVHAFWRDHGIEYNRTSVQRLETNLGKFARDLFQQ